MGGKFGASSAKTTQFRSFFDSEADHEPNYTITTHNTMNSIQGITNIAVQGFKSLYEECSIEIRPLTILAGANSSGKSSIMQPLLLMKQTLEAPYDPGYLLLNGPHVKFSLMQQLLSKIEPNRASGQFSVQIELERDSYIKNTYEKDKSILLSKIERKHDGREVYYSPDISKQELVYLISNYLSQKKEFALAQYFQYETDPMVQKMKWEFLRNRCFLSLVCQYEFDLESSPATVLTDLQLYDDHWQTDLFISQILHLAHIPGIRGNPERSYPLTAVSDNFPGIFEPYVASLIRDWQESDRESLVKLENGLNKLGLTSKIESTQINDVQVELRVSRLAKNPQTNDMVNIADVGIGVSQVLPVLVSLLVAEPGQLVYIEQPELHLHPRAQIVLGEILADAAKRGVRVVIETHSALLLLAIQTLVAEEKLAPDLVKLHWFSRREDGVTEVNSADLDETGAYGDWPEDFGDISLMLDNRYLSAAEAQLWRRTHGS
jgi:predicted ATPase